MAVRISANRECILAGIEEKDVDSPFLRAILRCSFRSNRLCLNSEVLASPENDASKCPAYDYDAAPDEDTAVDEFSTGE